MKILTSIKSTFVFFVFMGFTTTACASSTVDDGHHKVPPINQPTKNVISVDVPRNTAYLIAVDHSGRTLSFKGVDANGKPYDAKPCAVCTVELSHKYGKFCGELRKSSKLKKKVLSKTLGKNYSDLPFCAGTHKIEFLGVDSHQFIRTRMNPDCISKIESGGRIIWSIPTNCAH
jgi:hypothetical protein